MRVVVASADGVVFGDLDAHGEGDIGGRAVKKAKCVYQDLA